jgi:hypothetical protein
MSLELHKGYLWDLDRGRCLGEVQDRGYMGLEVRDPLLLTKVGDIGRSTMCGGSFLTFRPTSSPFNPPPIIRSSGFGL